MLGCDVNGVGILGSGNERNMKMYKNICRGITRLGTYFLVRDRLGIITLILLTWTKWRAPTNASKWRMGFNSAFKGLRSSRIWRKFCSIAGRTRKDAPLRCFTAVRDTYCKLINGQEASALISSRDVISCSAQVPWRSPTKRCANCISSSLYAVTDLT